MRTFIAIELDNNIREALSKIQLELKKADADVKWVSCENIHLTLKFLGEVKEEKIPEIIQRLKEITQVANSFQIEIKDIGAFPNMQSPRVIWAGIEEGKEKLLQLARGIEDALAKLKFRREEREFSAHITIGRIKSPKNKDVLSQRMSQLQFNPFSQTIQSIILFKSTLTPKGPIYEKIGEATFCK